MTGFRPRASKYFGRDFHAGGGRMQRRIRIQPRFWVFVIAAMLLCFGTSYAVIQARYGQIANRVEELSQEKVELVSRIDSLSNQLGYVSTDAYVERVARDELNMIRPGEVRYVSN